MQRLAAFSLCVSLVCTSPFPESPTNKLFMKDAGSRIINGQAANIGQIPYQAALLATGYYTTWFCSGSIISDKWILTAGHCVVDAIAIVVYTGLVDLDTDAGTQTDSFEFLLHKDFDMDTVANDIGLVKLSQPLILDANTSPITLSSDPLDAGVQVLVSGWGLTEDSGTTIASNLTQAQRVIITNQECDKTYGKSTIFEGMICGTSGNPNVKNSCSGDSGSPIVINGTTQLVQVGLVSFVTLSGCESGAPSGYTRIATHRDWIKGKTGV